MPKQTILIIEDERSLIDVLSYNLTKEGFEVVTASDGQEGLQKAQSLIPNLVILDLMLPVIDGLQVCQQLRADPRTRHIKIIMLTARSEEVDEIVGFNMGADDYVTKPFKIKPLIHRIKARLQPPVRETASKDIISLRNLEIDRVNHVVRIDNKEVALTLTEFKLLWTLARQPGRTFSRNELMDSSRGEDANALERTIDVHVRALRYKLGDNAHIIETVRGIGYRLKPE